MPAIRHSALAQQRFRGIDSIITSALLSSGILPLPRTNAGFIAYEGSFLRIRKPVMMTRTAGHKRNPAMKKSSNVGFRLKCDIVFIVYIIPKFQ